MTKTELLNLPNDEKNIIQLENRIKELKARLYSPQEMNFDEKVKATGHPAGNLAETVIDLENDLKRRKAEIKTKKETACRIFKRLDPEHRAIMKLYYVDGLTWHAIADFMILSPAQIFRKRNEAIQTLLKKTDKKAPTRAGDPGTRESSGTDPTENTAAEC